ncbi:hypothetical protein J437_LFUL005019 [Ladona fulva]|uniref:TGF-beta propeptide domain-containing protein n=1 Tax=Ladona fulva TaxID=123851 RepID=A0A8K0NUX9_LADFU|nr:hypothetical protein J437_LFUL005019 [Ladona fulva]
MNLLFNLTFPSTLDGSTISIVAAKLRLFKLAQGNVTSGTNPDGCPTPVLTPSPSPSTSTASETEQHSDALTVEVVPAADEPIVGPPASPLLGQHSSVLRISPTALQQDDWRIRVSVYWYTRSLKKHRSKRKLLDSQMVSISGQEEWVEFDVRHAARVWREPNRNFGLVVEVEDEDGAVLPAERYFAAMNCSKEASTSRPFPGFLYDAAWETGGTNNRGSSGSGAGSKSPGGAVGVGVGGSRTLGLNTHLFPLMDLCTIQYPEGEEAPSLSLLPSLSSSSAFGLPFGRRPSISVPPSPPVVMVACGGAGTNTQRQIVPVIHPTGGRQRSNRRPEEKSGNNAKFTEERGTRKKVQEKDEDNDAVATNQLSQRRDEGDAPVDDPVVESPSAIQVTKIRHPRRHLESGHSHRTREGRWAVEKEKSETNKDGNEEEEEDEEMREEKVSWQDAEGRQHVKRRVFVRKTIVSHKDGEGVKEGERVEEKDDGRSVTVMDHHGR